MPSPKGNSCFFVPPSGAYFEHVIGLGTQPLQPQPVMHPNHAQHERTLVFRCDLLNLLSGASGAKACFEFTATPVPR